MDNPNVCIVEDCTVVLMDGSRLCENHIPKVQGYVKPSDRDMRLCEYPMCLTYIRIDQQYCQKHNSNLGYISPSLGVQMIRDQKNHDQMVRDYKLAREGGYVYALTEMERFEVKQIIAEAVREALG